MQNGCGACGLDFGSLGAFDAHRVGKHAYTSTEGLAMDPPREDGRRCLHVWELEAQGFALNARGLYSLQRDLIRGREGRMAGPHTSQGHS